MGYFKKLIRPYLLWSVVLIVIPLLMIFLYAFTQSGNSLLNIQFTLDNFIKFADEVYVEVFVESFKLGLLTVIICFFSGLHPCLYHKSVFRKIAELSYTFGYYPNVDKYDYKNLCLEKYFRATGTYVYRLCSYGGTDLRIFALYGNTYSYIFVKNG